MSPADSKKPLVPYLRQSRAKEKTISLDDQRRAIRAWAKGAGVKLAREWVSRASRATSRGVEGRCGEPAGLVPNGHAQIVRRAFEIRAATPRASRSEVARLFEEAGVETRFGSERWSAATLHFLIANEVYTGLHRCTCGCGEEVVREEWEGVPGWLYRKAQVEPA